MRVVVGGGIAGLAAAHFLTDDPEADVLLLEGSPEVGGKLRRDLVAGVPLDVGAEAMLNRRPEGVALAEEFGLSVTHPAVVSSRIWSAGQLRRLPRTLMGVPLDLADLADSGLLSRSAMVRAEFERHLEPTAIGEDISMGDLVDARFGRDVTDVLVEPLLGGVYAGRAREISARAAAPQVVSWAEKGSILTAASTGASGEANPGAGTMSPPTSSASASVFAGIEGGMGLLPATMVEAGLFETRTRAAVHELRRTARGWQLVVGSRADSEVIDATSVVFATPPGATARLLADHAPLAARELASIETASVAVITLVFRARDLAATGSLVEDASGFLVPPREGLTIKAATYSYAKWAWVRDAGRGRGPRGEDLVFLRTSLGRHGDETSLQATDRELVFTSLTELALVAGVSADPLDWHVQRWGGGLPQYAVGHLGRVKRIRADVAVVSGAGEGGLAVCGAAYDGVGIPAVIGSARRATMEL